VADPSSPWGDGPIPFLITPAALGRAVRAVAEPLLRSLRFPTAPPSPDVVLRRTLNGLTVPGWGAWWQEPDPDTAAAAEAANGGVAGVAVAEAEVAEVAEVAEADAETIAVEVDVLAVATGDRRGDAPPAPAAGARSDHGPPRWTAPEPWAGAARRVPPPVRDVVRPALAGPVPGSLGTSPRRINRSFTRTSRRGHLRPPRPMEAIATLATMAIPSPSENPAGDAVDAVDDVGAAGAAPVDRSGGAVSVVGWSSEPDALEADTGADAGVPDPSASPHRFLNRELSWLAFNARVLALAEDPDTPLLERTKFLAIFSQNLDEFFQVRLAGLKDQLAAGLTAPSPDGRTAGEQLAELRVRIAELVERQERVFLHRVVPALSEVGIILSSWNELDEDDVKYLDEVFEERIFPVLTPLAVDPSHPFPYISDLSLNLAVVVHDPVEQARRFARVKMPLLLPRFVVMPDGERFVPLEEVIAQHLGTLFPGLEVEDHFSFRVTRNADLTLEEEDADDLLEAVEMELRRRRFGRAVRLELDADTTDEVRELLTRELDIEDDDIYLYAGPLDLGGLWSVHGLDRPDLKDPVWVPVTPPALTADDDEPVDFFRVLRTRDVLVHHPYSSFATSVEEFIRQASVDPKVLAIKLTLYRTSGDSSIIRSLTRAAERGKQVAALVELKARFDEKANIEWARRLEKAGVHVVYGLAGLKVHTKTTLVVRDEGDVMRRYCHVGTGNYNPRTARLYEDIGLLTADPDVGADLTQLFNFLTGYGRDLHFRKLLVSPQYVRPRIAELIGREMAAGAGEGRIVMKMNSLVDPALIDHLYEASRAGVEIDLVVRGICCLRPGVPGMSDNIRVRSIVGRYLEHSRLFYFAHGADAGGPVYYIGSADLMPRNLDRRVEALVPVQQPDLQDRLAEILDVNLADDTLAWELEPDGTWRHVPRSGRVDTHLTLQEAAPRRWPKGAGVA
jgi:polyphosphate kinase